MGLACVVGVSLVWACLTSRDSPGSGRGLDRVTVELLGAWYLAWGGPQLGQGNLDCGRSHGKFKFSSGRSFKAKGHRHGSAGTLTSSSWDPFSPALGPSPRSCLTATTKPPCCPGALPLAGLEPREARVTPTPHPRRRIWQQGA